MAPRAHPRRLAVAVGLLLALTGVTASLLTRGGGSEGAGALPDFANQKKVYEPAIGRSYTFTGVAAELLRPEDLGPDWYYGNDPALTPANKAMAHRRLVKATRASGGAWKAETCVIQQIRRWPTPTAAAADLEQRVRALDFPGRRQVLIEGVSVTELDVSTTLGAVFRRGNDVVNLDVCRHLATSDFSRAAAHAVVEAAVRRSAG